MFLTLSKITTSWLPNLTRLRHLHIVSTDYCRTKDNHVAVVLLYAGNDRKSNETIKNYEDRSNMKTEVKIGTY